MAVGFCSLGCVAEAERVADFCVALLYNLKENVPLEPGAPGDALAEYDSLETVQALEDALLAGGHRVIALEGDLNLYETLRRRREDIDIAFNICEGHQGDSRESQVPFLLEMLGIPYTGSRVLAHAISLDKPICKRVLRDYGLPTAPFQVFHRSDEPLDSQLQFPLFVKPSHEGTGMGISARSVVEDEAALRERVRWVIRRYQQAALVEVYLPGREFAVGVLGNGRVSGLPPPSEFYNEAGFHVFPVLELDTSTCLGEDRGVYNTGAKSVGLGQPGAPLCLCPAPIDATLEWELKRLAVAAFQAIGALDVSRVDFRLDAKGQPQIMEINTLPGLTSGFSDLCLMAEAEGMHYTALINEILNLAANRWELICDLGMSSCPADMAWL